MSYGHGGYRNGAGRKKKDIETKILEGTIKKSDLTPMILKKTKEEIEKLSEVKDMEEIKDIENASEVIDVEEKDMPKLEDYLKKMERDGKPLGADYEYKKMWKWLKLLKCEKLINPKLIEIYSINAARTKQCHEKLSDLGLVIKNAQGNPIASPFALMAISFEKAMNNQLMIINQIVKDNRDTSYLNYSERDSEMERILST